MAKPLVVFIPGFGGSELWRKGLTGLSFFDELRWFNPTAFVINGFTELALEDDGITPSIFTNRKVFPKVPINSYYGSIISYLQNSGFDLELWGWDFRPSAEFSSDLLRTKIESLADRWPLRFVTHSMGGLQLRIALNKYTEQENLERVACVTALGTPHRGSFEIVRVFAETSRAVWWLNFGSGNYLTIAPAPFYLGLIHQRSQATRTIATWPGAYMLLPWVGSTADPYLSGLSTYQVDSYPGAIRNYLKPQWFAWARAYNTGTPACPPGVRWFEYYSEAFDTLAGTAKTEDWSSEGDYLYLPGDGVVLRPSSFLQGATHISGPIGHSAWMTNGIVFTHIAITLQTGQPPGLEINCPVDASSAIF